MSSVRGGGLRGGRGRGSGTSAQNSTIPRGPSNTRGRAHNNAPRRGTGASRATFGQPTRGNGGQATRGRGGLAPGAKPFTSTRKTAAGGAMSSGSWPERQEQLQKYRAQEKRDAIAKGLMSDPDKQIGLSEAITIAGTCQDMCPEYERVLRTVRDEVWDEEKDVNQNTAAIGQAEPDEARMVKVFRRSAAGDEVQLPSDLRPPAVLKRTCDYLFNNMLGNATSLGKVHHFVWDRTRSIRNDFSIQQLTKLDDVRIAIDCYERIARFHIVSLHQLALPQKPYDKYDPQQEREQLDRTLLSLMQYYDDTRGRLDLPNEAEFRAYCIILQLRDPTPDLENRVQSWPVSITGDSRVRVALEVYAAACNTIWPEGPIKSTPHVIAKQDWQRFWTLVQSRKVSYLLGCVAEIHFAMIREMALNAIVRSARPARKKDGVTDANVEWTTEDLDDLFHFDSDEELEAFCMRWGLEFKVRDEDEHAYLDLRDLAGKPLPKGAAAKSTLSKSSLVEAKRHGRALPSVVDGLSVRQAKDAGMILEDDELDENMGSDEGEEEEEDGMENDEEGDEDSLFIPEAKGDEAGAKSAISFGAPEQAKASAFGQGSPFGQPSSAFGKPSSGFSFLKSAEANGDKDEGNQKSLLGLSGLTPAPDNATSKPNFSSPFGAPAATGAGFNFGSSSATATTSTLGGTLDAFSPKSTTSPYGQPATATSAPPNPFAPKTETASAPSNGLFQLGSSATTTPSTPAVENTPAAPALTFGFPNEPSKAAKSPVQDKAPPFTFGTSNGAPAAPSLSVQPETNSKSAPQTQPHSPSTTQPQSQPAHTSQNATISGGGSSSPPRRPSNTSWEAHKTKKPSPLSNSFTATDDNASSEQPPQSTYLPAQPFAQNLAPDRPSTSSRPPPSQAKPPATEAPPAEDPLDKLAADFTFNPDNGFLKQFLDFYVKQVIGEVHEKVFDEKCRIKCRALEEWRLKRVFGLRWREIARHRRLAAKSRQRRQRAHDRLQRSHRGDFSDSTSGAASTAPPQAANPQVRRQHRSRQDIVDALFQSVASERQATAGSKRSASVNGGDMANDKEPDHKRQKSMSHVDDRGRISKAPLTSHPNDDLLKRSSYLGFSLAGNPSSQPSTTRSTYFRLKALGLKKDHGSTVAGESRGTKRARSDSVDSSTPIAPRVDLSPAPRVTHEQRRDSESMPPPPSRAKTDADDDALFERLRAAREALKEGEELMKEENRRSMSGSLSSNDSPSMEKARADARLRASYGSMDLDMSTTSRPVAAYHSRESRFVPREEYGRARERALEKRASRSRESSRPTSRAEGQVSEELAPPKPAVEPKDQQSGFKDFKSNAADGSSASSISTSTSGPNGTFGSSMCPSKPAPTASPFSGFGAGPAFGAAKPAPAWPSAFGTQASAPQAASTSRNPFSQSSSFAPPASSGSNPFLQATVPKEPISTFGKAFTRHENNVPFNGLTQPAQDNTVLPSQIDQSLAHTFGQPAPAAPSPFAAPTTHGSPTSPQTNSYMPSQAASEAISLLSDDDEEQEQEESYGPYGQQEYYENNVDDGDGFGDFVDDTATQSFEQGATNFLQGAADYANSFAELANHGEDDEEDDEEDSDDDGDDGELEFGGNEALQPDSYQYSVSDAEEYEDGAGAGEYGDEPVVGTNGYYDEESEEDGDDEEDSGEEEDDFDEDEDDDDDDVPRQFASVNHAYNQHVQQAQQKGNPALQVEGNTAEEAIELSD